MSNSENDDLKRIQEQDARTATEQITRLTQKSVMGLRVEKACNTDKLRENFNQLLTRIADNEKRIQELEKKKSECQMKKRMEDTERRISAIKKENAKWHK